MSTSRRDVLKGVAAILAAGGLDLPLLSSPSKEQVPPNLVMPAGNADPRLLSVEAVQLVYGERDIMTYIPETPGNAGETKYIKNRDTLECISIVSDGSKWHVI